MADIFENVVLCSTCNRETSKAYTSRGGFQIRTWRCEPCNREWHHPLDLEEYKRFVALRKKTFNVKLRLVGNSYTVSIPREIIEFQEELQKDINKMIDISLDEPEKLTLYFSRRIRGLM